MLYPDTILQKTESAKQLLRNRTDQTLGLRQRTLIVLINGERSVNDLKQTLNTWSDVESICEYLLRHHYINATNPRAVEQVNDTPTLQDADMVKTFLINTAKQIFGKNAGPVIEILERTKSDPKSLSSAIAHCGRIATMMIDEKQARVFMHEAKTLRVPNLTTH